MRIFTRTVIFLVLLSSISALSPLDCRASGGGLSGIIRDATTGNPLAGVMVTLMEGRFNTRLQKSAVTNWEGKFEISNLLPGVYSLRVNASAYIPLIRSGIRIFSGRIAELSLILESLYPSPSNPNVRNANYEPVHEEIESVLRSAASQRPVLRMLDSGNTEVGRADASLELHNPPLTSNEIRGVLNIYTTAYAADPYLSGTGGMFTEFAFVRDVSASTSVTVAGVASDAGFAEFDAMIRLKGIQGHHPSLRASFGKLPFVSVVSPIIDGHLQELNVYSFDFQDEIHLSNLLSIIYGLEFQGTNAQEVKGRRLMPRWGLESRPFIGNKTHFLHTNSLPRMNRTLELPDGENMVFSSPFHQELTNSSYLGLPQVAHSEFASTQTIDKKSSLSAAFYADRFRAQTALESLNNNFRLFNQKGVRLAYQRVFYDFLSGTIGYTYGGGLQLEGVTQYFRPAYFHVLTARLTSEMPSWGTRLGVTYRWISSPSLTVIDPYQEIFESTSPRMGLMIAQVIPYVGRFLPGRLEAQLEMRNLFTDRATQYADSLALRRVVFAQSLKSVHGGLRLLF